MVRNALDTQNNPKKLERDYLCDHEDAKLLAKEIEDYWRKQGRIIKTNVIPQKVQGQKTKYFIRSNLKFTVDL